MVAISLLETTRRRWSGPELATRAGAYAQALRAQGLQPGQVCGLVGPQGPEYLLALIAVWLAGGVVLPLNPRLPDSALEAALADAGARWCLGGPPGPRWLSWQKLAGSPADGPPGQLSYGPEQPCSLILTSGSSGLPKLAFHTFASHHASAGIANHALDLGPGDRWLLALPLFHVGGLAIVLRCQLAGAGIVLPEAGEELAETVTRLRPSHLSLVATQLQRLLTVPAAIQALQAARVILLGGSAIPRALIARAHGLGLPIHTSYGATETSSLVTCTPTPADLDSLYSSGLPLAPNRLRIAADGEIQIDSPALFEGYFTSQASLEQLTAGNPDPPGCWDFARDSVFRLPYELERPLTPDRWLKTRDKGYLDPHGRLHVLGRLDNLIISGGENIQPEEIEAALLALPGVTQAIVVPVPHPEFGQRPVAFVESPAFDVLNLKSALRDQLPSFKIPDTFYPWPPDQLGLKPSRQALSTLAETFFSK